MRTRRPWIGLAALLLAATCSPAAEVSTGIDVLIENGFRELQGKKVGLITNQTGKTKTGLSTVQALAGTNAVQLKALFSPEHGFAGTIEDAHVSSDTLKLADNRVIPIYSLYGSTMAPTSDMLTGLDALVFDIQDIGARFYTYAATMGMAMESAAKANLEFYVLDRPNPINGDTIEGPILSMDIRHITAYFQIPIRHGLTLGEIARLHNSVGNVGAKLQVIPLRGWSREMWYDQTGLPWTKPSPNMPDLNAATLYPGVACFESTNLSVGRGTESPFGWVGAPWLKSKKVLERLRKADLAGVVFEMEDNAPSKSLYAGVPCKGIRIKITDRNRVRPTEIFAHLACILRDVQSEDFQIRWDEIRRMVGTDEFQKLYESGAKPEDIIRLFEAGALEFQSTHDVFLLY